MQRYSIEPTTRKHFKGYGFLSLKKIQKKNGYRTKCSKILLPKKKFIKETNFQEIKLQTQ